MFENVFHGAEEINIGEDLGILAVDGNPQPPATEPQPPEAPDAPESTPSSESEEEKKEEESQQPEGGQGGAPPEEEESEVSFDEDGIFLKKASEYMGREFKSADDFSAALEEFKKPKDPEYPSEWVKNLVDYAQKSGAKSDEEFRSMVADWAALQTTDFDRLASEDPKSLVAMHLKRKYPNLTSEEAEMKVARSYKVDKGDFGEDEDEDTVSDQIRMNTINLKIAAKEAAEEMKAIQTDLAVPEAEKNRIQEQDKRQEEQQKKLNAYVDQAKAWMSSFKSLGLDKDLDFSVEQEKDGKIHPMFEGTVNALNDPGSFINRFFNPTTGTWKPEEIGRAQYILDNFPAIVKTIAERAKGSEAKEITDKLRNNTPAPDKPPVSDDASPSEYNAARLSEVGIPYNI